MNEGDYNAEAMECQMILHDPPDHPYFNIETWADYFAVQSMIGDAELERER